MKMTRVRVAAALALLACALPAAAQVTGGYLGLGFGQSRIQADVGAIDAAARRLGFGSSATSADETDTAIKVYLGHRYNRHFAVEAGYTDFGRFSLSTATTGPAASTAGELRGHALNLDAVGIAPVSDRFMLFGKVGIQRWQLSANSAALNAGVPTMAMASARGNDWKLGLGAQYDFSRKVAVRFEWERFVNVGDTPTTGRGNIDVLAIGVQYKF
jgi:OOP family OmpA-OmpF porin